MNNLIYSRDERTAQRGQLSRSSAANVDTKFKALPINNVIAGHDEIRFLPIPSSHRDHLVRNALLIMALTIVVLVTTNADARGGHGRHGGHHFGGHHYSGHGYWPHFYGPSISLGYYGRGYYRPEHYYVYPEETNVIVQQGALQPEVNEKIFIYPSENQSEELQAKDRYECHLWAVQQSSFDPSRSTQTTTVATRVPGRADDSGILPSNPILGAAGGAALGAMGGAIAGDPGIGAAIGAAVGGVAGLLGLAKEAHAEPQNVTVITETFPDPKEQADYRRAQSACLHGRGYVVR